MMIRKSKLVISLQCIHIASVLVHFMAIISIPVVFLHSCNSIMQEKSWPFISTFLLHHSSIIHHRLVEWILNEIPSRQRLIIWKNDAVIFRITLMTSFSCPLIRFFLLWTESTNIVCKHVKIRSIVNDPRCKLICTSCAQHHSSWVESTIVEKSRNGRIWSHQRLVIRRETFRSTNCRLDSSFAEFWAQFHCTFDVSVEDWIVKIVKSKVEVFWYTIEKNWIIFVSTHANAAALNAKVNRIIVIANIWHSVDFFDGLRYDISVFHWHKWEMNVVLFQEILAPNSSCVDDNASVDCAWNTLMNELDKVRFSHF